MGPLLFLLYTKPGSAVIDQHSRLHGRFADDTVAKARSDFDLQQMIATTQDYISDLHADPKLLPMY